MGDLRPSHHPAWVRVDLDRIRENLLALRGLAGDRVVIPVIKANAYGHGAIAVARALQPLGVPMLAVAYVDEAVALRGAGIETPLLVLTGFAPLQFDDVRRFRLTPVVSTPEQVETIERSRRDGDVPDLAVHVKVDTGMSRLGFSIQQIEPVIHRLEELEGVEIAGLMTHLASADEDEAVTARQLDLFDEAIIRLETLGVRPPLIHAANSAGMAALRETHSAVRPGLLLYGLRPEPLGPDIVVRPAMQVRARVARIQMVEKGTAVSYGGRFVAPSAARIATINTGYADGVPRTDRMREAGRFESAETGLPVAGAVCMDLTMVDATLAPGLEVGDEVTVFGESPTAWEVAGWAGTNAWQVLAGVDLRLPRRYVLGGAMVGEDLVPWN